MMLSTVSFQQKFPNRSVASLAPKATAFKGNTPHSKPMQTLNRPDAGGVNPQVLAWGAMLSVILLPFAAFMLTINRFPQIASHTLDQLEQTAALTADENCVKTVLDSDLHKRCLKEDGTVIVENGLTPEIQIYNINGTKTVCPYTQGLIYPSDATCRTEAIDAFDAALIGGSINFANPNNQSPQGIQ